MEEHRREVRNSVAREKYQQRQRKAELAKPIEMPELEMTEYEMVRQQIIKEREAALVEAGWTGFSSDY